MKTKLKKLTLAAVFALSSGLLLASGGHEEMRLIDYTPLKKEIRNQIPFPEFAKKPQANERVAISFKVSADGSLSLVSISSDNARLADYIKEVLPTLRVNNRYANEEIYTAEINFKVL